MVGGRLESKKKRSVEAQRQRRWRFLALSTAVAEAEPSRGGPPSVKSAVPHPPPRDSLPPRCCHLYPRGLHPGPALRAFLARRHGHRGPRDVLEVTCTGCCPEGAGGWGWGWCDRGWGKASSNRWLEDGIRLDGPASELKKVQTSVLNHVPKPRTSSKWEKRE